MQRRKVRLWSLSLLCSKADLSLFTLNSKDSLTPLLERELEPVSSLENIPRRRAFVDPLPPRQRSASCPWLSLLVCSVSVLV